VADNVASHASADEPAIAVADVALSLAWNVRGDAAHVRFVEAVTRTLGLALPLRPNTSTRTEDAALLWLGPTSWLLLATPDPSRGAFGDARRALNDAGGALFDLSSGYIAWQVAGRAAARVLNRGCPLDLHPAAFPAGHCAQSVLGHLTALVHRPDESSAFIVLVARSFACDAQAFLADAAATEG
jgi:sarcosine oxidase subunit gamma